MITAKHPSRKQVAALTTTNNYYPTKGDAISAVDKVLEQYGWTTGDCNPLGDTGRLSVPVVRNDERGLLVEEVGTLAFSWYRMPSGRYECTLYLA